MRVFTVTSLLTADNWSHHKQPPPSLLDMNETVLLPMLPAIYSLISSDLLALHPVSSEGLSWALWWLETFLDRFLGPPASWASQFLRNWCPEQHWQLLWALGSTRPSLAPKLWNLSVLINVSKGSILWPKMLKPKGLAKYTTKYSYYIISESWWLSFIQRITKKVSAAMNEGLTVNQDWQASSALLGSAWLVLPSSVKTIP